MDRRLTAPRAGRPPAAGLLEGKTQDNSPRMITGRFVWRMRRSLPASVEAEASTLSLGFYDMLVASPCVSARLVEELVDLLALQWRRGGGDWSEAEAFEYLGLAAGCSRGLSALFRFLCPAGPVRAWAWAAGSESRSESGGSTEEEEERSDAEDGGEWLEDVAEGWSSGGEGVSA